MNEMSGISGKWMNKYTGQFIMVRDSIIVGDDMIVITDQGQIDMAEFSRDYIQTSDELYDETGRVIDNKPASFSEVKQPTNTPDYDFNKPSYDVELLLDKPLFNKEAVNNKATSTVSKIETSETNTSSSQNFKNFDLIDRLFKRKNYNPTIIVDIKSDDFPINELKMLMDIYDVDSADIANYLLKEYINKDSICESVFNYVEKKFYKI